MAKKKKLTKAERKEARLRKGKQWLITYTGSPKKMNKHYRERFHVDAVTAAIGVRIPQCFFRMASGKCCSYMSIDFAVRQIISGKDTILLISFMRITKYIPFRIRCAKVLKLS